jgi:hypothetical protein
MTDIFNVVVVGATDKVKEKYIGCIDGQYKSKEIARIAKKNIKSKFPFLKLEVMKGFCGDSYLNKTDLYNKNTLHV